MEDEGAGGPEIISPFAPQRVHFFQTEPSLSVSCPLKSCPNAGIGVREVSWPQEVHLYIVTPSEVQVAGVVVPESGVCVCSTVRLSKTAPHLVQ